MVSRGLLNKTHVGNTLLKLSWDFPSHLHPFFKKKNLPHYLTHYSITCNTDKCGSIFKIKI